MKIKLITLMIAIMMSASVFLPGARDGIDLFVKIDGFSFDGEIETYTSDTLFEYINGGADLFLNFEFVKLNSLRYKSTEGGEITVDIYAHADLPNGFGIYTQERSEEGNFIKTGTEGYYEEGILNFFQGPAYVKISSFDLGEDEEQILKKLAHGISENIPYSKGYPEIFSKFPSEGKIPGSEKYINLNFLGHSFLNRVYSGDYLRGGKKLKFFVINSDSALESEKVLSKYTEFAKGKGAIVKKENNIIRFIDPYYKNEGEMNILVSGRMLFGMFCDVPELFLQMTRSFTGNK